MAHGFLSYKDTRGQSGIEKFLEKKFDEQTKVLGGFIKDQVKQGIINALFNLRTKSPRSPKPYSWAKEDSTPIQRMLGSSALQRALPGGSDAVNAEVVGGGLTKGGFIGRPLRPEGFASDAIIDIGATSVGVESDNGNFFPTSIQPVGGGDSGSGEVVQAIDRLTFVTMSLVQATKEQTDNQSRIANAQQQEAAKLARKALVSSEAASFTKDDFSSNIAYERLAAAGGGMIRGGGAGGGLALGAGLGLGGKAAASALGRSVMRRGGARAGTRLGIAVGGKLGKGLGKTLGKRLGGKAIGKIAGTGLAKALGKKIPLVGLGLGAIFAAQRALQGDFIGAGLELASGAASTVPGVGTAASVGIDAALMAKDMTAMADGGIVDSATNAIIGEDGREGVFPLEGSRGKKTFRMFGEGLLEAQRGNKSLFGKLQAEGFKEYYDRQNGLARFMEGFNGSGFFEGLKEILGAITLPMGYKPFQFNGNGDSSGNNGGNSDNTSIKRNYGEKDGWFAGKNSGQDMDVNADGVFTSKVGGVVAKIGEHKDLGPYVDIVNEEKGITERISDISGVLPGIEVGSAITAGQPVAKGNDAGVVHYEIREGGNAEKYKPKFGFDGTLNPTEFLKENNLIENNTTNIDQVGNHDDPFIDKDGNEINIGDWVGGPEETSSNLLNTMSEEIATTGNGTTIINNITNNNMTNGSSNGDDVTLGSTSTEMGVTGFYAQMQLRAA